jgi:cell division septum initiation protein DivIVA
LALSTLRALDPCEEQLTLAEALANPEGDIPLTRRTLALATAAGLDLHWLALRLPPPQRAEYDRVVGAARAECDRVVGPARAECDRVTGPALAEYDRVVGPARAEYDRVVDAAWAEFDRVVGPARAEYVSGVDAALLDALQSTAAGA